VTDVAAKAAPDESDKRAQEDKHPHAPAGTPAGGQFTKSTGGGTKPPAKAPTKRTIPAKKPAPKAAPGKATKQTGTLRRGGANDAGQVKQLQALLRELGISGLAIDGAFGPDTEAAVKAAQTKLGLKPTGRASSALTRRLHDAHALSPCVPRSGSKVSAMAYVDDVTDDEDDFDDELEDDDVEELDDDEEDDDVEPVMAAAGHDTTMGHDELHHYWVAGPGLARWAGSPTPWTTLLANLVEEVKDKPLLVLKKWASAWFIEHFHYAAGSDLNRVNHGKPPRGDVVGPG
jgi:hypothetical protein